MMEAVDGQQALLAALLCLLATAAWYFLARGQPSAPDPDPEPQPEPEPEPECWICYSAVSPEEPDEPLLRGCACRGTAGHVHVSCLAQAAGRKKRVWTECPACKQRYTGELFVALSRAHWALVRERPIASEERLAAANSLAAALRGVGRPAEAAALAEESLAALRAKHGADHPHTLAAMNNLAQIRQAAGELEGAAELAEAALAAYRRTLGPDDSRTLLAANNLGGIKHAQGKLPAAARLFEGALAGFTRNQGKDHPDILTATHNLGGLHLEMGDLYRATVLLEAALAGRNRTLGADHPEAQRTARALAQLDALVGFRLVGATRLPYSEAVLDLRRKVMWPDKPRDFSAVEGDEDTALHFAIRARFERRDGRLDYRLLSLVSVWLSSDGMEAQFRKFCTDQDYQGRGLGVALLTFAIESLRGGAAPIRRLWCNARVEQTPFYSKHFAMVVMEGTEFEKGGRDYVLMERLFEEGVE